MSRDLRTFIGIACVAVAAMTPSGLRGEEKSSSHANHSASGKSTLGVVSLDVFAESESCLHLLTAARDVVGEPPRLAYVRSDDGGETWGTPVPVGTGLPTPDPVKRGNDAQIVAAGGRLLAVWTMGANTKMGRGPLAAARSDDGGRTWRAAKTPSDADGVIDHAFVDLAADERGTFHAVWLDARTSGKPSEYPGKGLRYARSTDGGATWSANVTLDEQCCECCWNSLLVTRDSGIHVLFRDKDPRDMAMASSRDGGQSWSRPVPVGSFGWDMKGCPHVGGALAQAGGDDDSDRTMVAVVWTAKGGADLGTFVLSSQDDGKTWTAPAPLGGQDSSRPDVASSAGRLVSVWDTGGVTFASTSSDRGKTWSSAPMRLSEPGAFATHARVVARSGGGFRVFWTEKRARKPTTWTSRPID